MNKVMKFALVVLTGSMLFVPGLCESYKDCVERCEEENKKNDRNVNCPAACDTTESPDSPKKEELAMVR